MSDAWDDKRRANEEEYFNKQNKAAMERLKSRTADKPRLSPVTGKPMQQVTLMGVNIDKCPDSGGIWLDPGELEELINASKSSSEQSGGFFDGLLKSLKGK